MDNSRPKCSSYSSPGNLKKKKNNNRKQHPSNVDEKKQLYIKKKEAYKDYEISLIKTAKHQRMYGHCL